MKSPGPTMLQFLTAVRRRGFLDAVGDFWREYGDLFQVRVAGRTLVFAMHPDMVEHVTVRQRQNYDKRASYDGVRDYLIGDGLVASTGELWRRQRRLMAPFYTPAGVQAYAELMVRDGQSLVTRWEALAATGAEVDIAEEMTNITASIILKAMFSTETIEAIHEMKGAVETMLGFVNDRLTGLSLPLWVPTRQNRAYKAARELVEHSIRGLIEQRRRTDEAAWPDDLLSRLMRARDEETGEPMSESLLRDESITIFFAGHETTARTMSFIWYALAQYPEVAARLHEELDRVLGGATPTVEQLRQLPYTLQVIKEAMRLYPAAPFYARDVVADDQIMGFDVPTGASVMLSPYFTQRHPQFWENPETFDPERWSPDRETGQHRYAYHPFAAGPRICIGNNFSLLESHLLLAMLAQHFAPQLRAGHVPHIEMQGALTMANGLPMTINARQAELVEA